MTKKMCSCGPWLLIASIAIGASAAFAAEPRESAALAAQRQRMKDRARRQAANRLKAEKLFKSQGQSDAFARKRSEHRALSARLPLPP